jgi:predicted transposase YbfD/YdcC
MAATSIERHFGALLDPRIERCRLHKLIDIVTITICAVISNADGWEDIEAYAYSKQPLFQQFLELPHGIPSHDTFERVFARLDPDVFQHCFLDWVSHIRTKLPGEVIAIDGKTSRGTRDSLLDLSPLHLVSAWSSVNGLVLGQLRTADKSNEITAIPLLLEVLDIRGSIITIDALGCQTPIVETVIKNDGDYVITCKGNQEHLHEDIVALFTDLLSTPTPTAEMSYYKTIDEQHGRREIREYWSTAQLDTLRTRDRWAGLQSVAMVRSERHTLDKVAKETRYFISSLPADAQQLARAIRTHWTIENQLHWVLDVVFHEDASRARVDHSGHNLAIIRHITLNMLRQETSLKKSIRQKRLRAGWDDTYMLRVIQVDLAKVEQM